MRQLLTHTSGLRDNMGGGDIDQAVLATAFRAGLAHAAVKPSRKHI